MNNTPVLETARLHLRPVCLEDAPAIQKHFNDWEIIRHLSSVVPWPYPDDGALNYLRDELLPRMKNGTGKAWAIILREGANEAIGLIEYRCGEGETDHRGFWLGRAHQGRGYMTEAITAFNDYIFFDLGVDSIVVHNARPNLRSRRVKEKTGAEFIGLVEMPHHQGVIETEQWLVTRASWMAQRKEV